MPWLTRAPITASVHSWARVFACARDSILLGGGGGVELAGASGREGVCERETARKTERGAVEETGRETEIQIDVDR